MNEYEQIKVLINKNDNDIRELERLVEVIESQDLQKENDELKNKLIDITLKNNKMKHSLKHYRELSGELQEKLQQEILEKRSQILNESQKQLNVFFDRTSESDFDTIIKIENKYKNEFIKIQKILHNNALDEDIELKAKMNEFTSLLDDKVKKIKQQEQIEKEKLNNQLVFGYDALEKEALPDNAINNIERKLNLEMKLGNNVLNIIGMFLILMGVIFGLQYAFTNIFKSDELKSALGFIFGTMLLVLGEVLQNKKQSAFGKGFTAGGISILFATTGISYFGLGVLEMYPALAICIVISIISYIMAMRYDSKLIIIFAYFGSYLPMTALVNSSAMIYGAMIYFLIINIFTLFLSTHKKWRFIVYISFLFHYITSFLILIMGIGVVHIFWQLNYIVLSLILYIGIILSNDIINKTKIRTSEIIVLYINTIINIILIFSILNLSFYGGFEHYGLIIIGLFLIYLIGAKISEKVFAHDKRVIFLFYLTALVLSIFIIPIQLGLDYVFIGWLIQAVAFIIYGIYADIKIISNIGGALIALCMAIFFMESGNILDYTGTYFLDYFYKEVFHNLIVLALSLNSLLAFYLTIGTKYNPFKANGSFEIYKSTNLFKIIELVTIIFNCYFIFITGLELIYFTNLNITYSQTIKASYIIVFSLLLLYMFILKHIKRINPKLVTYVRIFSNIVVGIGLLTINVENLFLSMTDYILFFMVLVLNAVSIYSVYNFIKYLYEEERIKNLGLCYFLPSLYGVIIYMIAINNLFNFGIDSIAMSLIAMVVALVWIILGFKFRIKVMRVFGLYLSIFLTIKLFLIDLSNLNHGLRIISYFGFGIVLISISAVYQYFNNRVSNRGNND